jgi:hypothetical protein
MAGGYAGQVAETAKRFEPLRQEHLRRLREQSAARWKRVG